MSRRGLAKKSLDSSGATAAFLVGFLALASSWRCGTCLLVFYFSSSKVTKLGQKTKAKLEDEFRDGGQRNACQVFTNSLPAVVAAVFACIHTYWREGLVAERLELSFHANPVHAALCCVCIFFFAACNGDTWSSELGILSPTPPVMVTNPCRQAPPGTNGAISLVGTAASLVAGALVGVAWLATTALLGAWGGGEGGDLWPLLQQQAWLVPAAGLAGTAGSLLDSLLGATLQQSVLRRSNGVVVSATRARELVAAGDEAADDFMALAGLDVLSNEGVNLVASTATALLGAALLLAAN